jgi:flagellar protein FliS
MTLAPHTQYWETQIRTATPQKLRLLLIEGALHYGHKAIDDWNGGDYDQGFTAATRCQDILFELLGAVRKNGDSLNQQVIELYVYLAKQSQLAIRQRNSEILHGILRVLEEERATWQMVCDRFPQPIEELDRDACPTEITADSLPAIPPDVIGHQATGRVATASSFSLEA